jgi:magnesium chelatase family protein
MKSYHKIFSSVLYGIDAQVVEVQCETGSGKERFSIIGLADNAIKESKDRVSSALKASGFEVPRSTLINLAPAELKKEGASLDLAIATSILSASKQLTYVYSESTYIHGELSLDGSVRPVKGILSIALKAKDNGCKMLIIPMENLQEALLVPGIRILPIAHLKDLQVLNFSEIEEKIKVYSVDNAFINSIKQQQNEDDTKDTSSVYIWGQEQAKRGLLLAAIGGHNLLMTGPPGCGKSLIAQCLPKILPRLSEDEIREVVKIHSVLGKPLKKLIFGERPLSAPHQGISEIGFTGGGSLSPSPGEMSIAHLGVLFLDELPEYKRAVLESLRTPLETGEIHLRRSRYSVVLPAKFQLITAMNPCPCGRRNDGTSLCVCSTQQIANYRSKISHALLDRIDLQVHLKRYIPKAHDIEDVKDSKSDRVKEISIFDCKKMRTQVERLRDLQINRQGKLNSELNSQACIRELKGDKKLFDYLEKASTALNLSSRVYVRTIRLARTIADLHESPSITLESLSKALTYRL